MATYRIEGARIHGIDDFYGELNRLVMTSENWRLGASLDGLNDLLYGGIGALADDDDPQFVWADHDLSRTSLGTSATRAWLTAKLEGPFNHALIQQQLADLEAGTGKTYFELVLEVFAEHPGVGLTLA
ncbi:ribonuclease inhibitor [Branchiibius sp. NY16-3462-2]|uniref:ribonuclease inhibitor n=1 Tax=Branchiibius sp. NY16-3462-2 TaxID=1807500 RepID=UPI000796DFEB|nr:ribonuclease inhibitor [Branchiibius sp. NY16-3462-2]KYH44214.1 ribonuclease inhibitor [Branchiibius sp. NY16-3462-2]